MEEGTSTVIAHEPEPIPQVVCGWNLAKLNRAKRMLLSGFDAKQVGRELSLSPAQVSELEIDAEDLGEKEQIESYAEWRNRKARSIERTLVGIVEQQLEYSENTELDSEGMGIVKDASAIAHKWLRAGEDAPSVRSVTVNFSNLAQIKPAPMPDKASGPVIELPSGDE